MPRLVTTAEPNGIGVRIRRLESLLSRVASAPESWLAAGKSHDRIEPLACDSWEAVEDAWKRCQRWRQSLSDMLSTMLAVAASTSQTGNQLHLLVVADAGSSKTTLCDAMLTSKKCVVVEGITGLVSGAKSDDGRDLSFLARANHLTWITPEGDVLVTSPSFAELMSQARRVFDGKFSQVYKTTDEDLNFEGLRTPWIIAGTPFMIDYWDQSRLGDRFLRIWLDQPNEDEKRKIVRQAMLNEWEAVTEHSNGSSGGIETKLRRAYAMTGGYVEWLREHSGMIDQVTAEPWVFERIMDLADFTADMRAKPNTDPRKTDVHDTKELPTRISRQLVRLARCMAMVLRKNQVDAEVMRRVQKVAMDSSRGRTLDLLRWFRTVNPRTGRTFQEDEGIMTGQMSRWAGFDSEAKCLAYLNFLMKIDVVEHMQSEHSHGHWKMTRRVDNLHRAIICK